MLIIPSHLEVSASFQRPGQRKVANRFNGSAVINKYPEYLYITRKQSALGGTVQWVAHFRSIL